MFLRTPLANVLQLYVGLPGGAYPQSKYMKFHLAYTIHPIKNSEPSFIVSKPSNSSDFNQPSDLVNSGSKVIVPSSMLSFDIRSVSKPCEVFTKTVHL